MFRCGLILIFLYILSCEARKYSIQLIKQKSAFENMLRDNMHISVIDEIYNIEKENYFKKLKDGGKAPVPLFRYLDSEFYGEILIGRPGQKFNVVFDTLWAFSWVPSILCPDLKIPCAMRNKYNGDRSSESTNLFKPYSIPLGYSNLTGALWKDVVHVNQINVTDQVFVAVFDLPWEFIFSKSDGAIGLSPDYRAIPGAVPVFVNMIQQKKIDKSIFSIYMNRDPNSKKGGTIMFGGSEPKHYNGSFTYLKVDPQSGRWAFKLNKIQVGKNYTVCAKGCMAIPDTSSNIINGPKDDIAIIHNATKATYFGAGRYKVDCAFVNKGPKIIISMNGRDFIMKGSDYTQEFNIGPVTFCLSLFTSRDTEDVWTLGGAFIAKYYVTFDLDNFKVGFADARM